MAGAFAVLQKREGVWRAEKERKRKRKKEKERDAVWSVGIFAVTASAAAEGLARI